MIITILTIAAYNFRDEKSNFYFEFSKNKRLVQLLLIAILTISGNLFNPIFGLEIFIGEISTVLIILLIVDTAFFCEFRFSHGFFFCIFLPSYVLFSPFFQEINSGAKNAFLISVSVISFFLLFVMIFTQPLKFFGGYEFIKNVKKSEFYNDYEKDGTL